MTRAALLHLLDSPTSLSAAAVQDLEQLVQAFPYCQTAHLLLAKAAHDQGSMLAGQRLRRAATYAADRQLLRQLLERPAPQAAPAAVGGEVGEEVTPTPLPAPEPAALIEEVAAALPVAAAASVPAAGVGAVNLSVDEANEANNADNLTPASASEAAAEAPAEATTVEPAAAKAQAGAESEAPEALAAPSAAPGEEPGGPPESGIAAGASEAHTSTDPQLAEQAQPVAVEDFPDSSAELPAAASEITGPDEAQAAGPFSADEPTAAAAGHAPSVTADEAAAAALPPIQPPAEVGAARFEFGLSSHASALAAEFEVYQLPELPSEEAAASGRRPAAPAAPELGAFRGAEELAYALSGGSRLGYAVQPSELAAEAGAAPAGPPGSALPPAGEFFAPDALLLEHLASQPPLAPPTPSSLELIDSFLRRAPQRRRGIVTLLTVPEQADLSMRSTRAEPDLASESLARILAGQGKTERAIAVYERLMVRQPEKSAYFAVQIELLRNPPTPSS